MSLCFQIFFCRQLETNLKIDVYEMSSEMAPMFCTFVKDALTLFKYIYKINFSFNISWFSLNPVKNLGNWIHVLNYLAEEEIKLKYNTKSLKCEVKGSVFLAVLPFGHLRRYLPSTNLVIVQTNAMTKRPLFTAVQDNQKSNFLPKLSLFFFLFFFCFLYISVLLHPILLPNYF